MSDSRAHSPPTPRRWKRWACLGLIAVVVGLGAWCWPSLFGLNFHEVVPGQVYRCAQPNAADLDEVVRSHGIRTVVSLRGPQEAVPWYMEEVTAAARLDLHHEDLSLSASHLPPPEELRRLVEILDRAERPILLHCYRGVDRTGLSSVLARLLLTNDTLDQALPHLSLRYGHVSLGRTRHLQPFFDLYREWLAARGVEHSPQHLRQWLARDYCPGRCQARIELVETGREPLRLTAGKPAALRLRCTNTSVRDWVMSRDPNAGVSLFWWLVRTEDQMPVRTGKAGLFERTVRPGEAVEITVVLPSLEPGHYTVRLDMEEAQHCRFSMAGTPPGEWSLEVGP